MKFLIRRSMIAVVTMLALPANAVAQELLSVDDYCSYGGEALPEQVYGFVSSDEARAEVARIVRYTGLVQNFEISAANIDGAMATMSGSRRLILYNQQFMIRVRDRTNTDWAAISILAHEVGHHLQGHVLTPGGSRPPTELEADRYSGYVLFRMGASLDDSLAAMRALGSPTASATHPDRNTRLAAITNGWIAACELGPNPATCSRGSGTVSPPIGPITTTDDPITPPIEPIDPPQAQFVALVRFAGDPAQYFVTRNDDIVAVVPGRPPTIIGRKTPPTAPGFAWMYQTFYITYGVTPTGQVMNRSPFGVPFQIGEVVAAP